MTPLRQRMTEEMEIRNYSPKTIRIYVAHLVKFFDFCDKSPARVSPDEIRDYLVYLVEVKGTKWGVYNQIVSALRFLFREIVHRGEIVGLAGLMGAGRSELLRAIFGADSHRSGQLWVGSDEAPSTLRSPHDAVKRGLALLPEDRT